MCLKHFQTIIQKDITTIFSRVLKNNAPMDIRTKLNCKLNYLLYYHQRLRNTLKDFSCFILFSYPTFNFSF